jgi:hypothetical protein
VLPHKKIVQPHPTTNAYVLAHEKYSCLPVLLLLPEWWIVGTLIYFRLAITIKFAIYLICQHYTKQGIF